MCTNFSIKTKQNDLVIGRTMELGKSLDSELYFRKKGHHYKQNASDLFLEIIKKEPSEIVLKPNLSLLKDHICTWNGIYGFVAMNGFGQDIAADGMNTEGLTTGTMVLALSEYQPVPAYTADEEVTKDLIYYPNLTNWILSNCKNCNDVISKLSVDKLNLSENSRLEDKCNDLESGLKVISPFKKVPEALNFHFPVHDALGNNIVLEFVNGELTITDLAPINVLTNDPEIAWHHTNVMNNFGAITPYNYQDAKGNADYETMEEGKEETSNTIANNFRCKTFAQGTGFGMIPGSPTPVDRFVKTAMMTNFSFKPKTIEDAYTLAFHILNTVDIPKGTSLEKNNKTVHDYTQWSTVSDLKNKIYTIRLYESPQVFRIDVDKLDFDNLDGTHFQIPAKKYQWINLNDKINARVVINEKFSFQEN